MKNKNASDVHQVLREFYIDEPFIKLYSGEDMPKLSDVKNSNNVILKVIDDYSNKRIIIISCLDNLVKGAAGQAIQNMNVMFGFDETESLV